MPKVNVTLEYEGMSLYDFKQYLCNRNTIKSFVIEHEVPNDKKDRIEIGDIVDIYFERCECLVGYKVLYIPQSDNDVWHLEYKNKYVDELIYLKNFAYMRLKKHE